MENTFESYKPKPNFAFEELKKKLSDFVVRYGDTSFDTIAEVKNNSDITTFSWNIFNEKYIPDKENIQNDINTMTLMLRDYKIHAQRDLSDTDTLAEWERITNKLITNIQEKFPNIKIPENLKEV